MARPEQTRLRSEDDDRRYEALRYKPAHVPPRSYREFLERSVGEEAYSAQWGLGERGHGAYDAYFEREHEQIGQHSGNARVDPDEVSVWEPPVRRYREVDGRLRSERPPWHGLGPRNYVRSDERIYEDVCEELIHDGELDASGIEVLVDGGEVTLFGTVRDRWSKRRAENDCYAVPGVFDVHNRLQVRRKRR